MPVGPIGGSHYVYDLDGHLIAEADALTGATIREYLWLNDRPIAIVDTVSTTPVLYFVHADHLARPVLVTDGAKAPVWSAVWKPFGEAQSITGPLSLDARFPGQWFQIETGLAYNWHRHFDAATGRYTQPDPLGFVDGPSLYSYARSSPQSYVDEDGRELKGGQRSSGCKGRPPLRGTEIHIYMSIVLSGNRLSPQFNTGLNGLSGGGLVDMYSPVSGEIWDFKPTTYGSGSKYRKGKDQVMRYVNSGNSSLRRVSRNWMPGSWASLFGSQTSVSFPHATHGIVTLWPDEQPGTGLIFYSCEPVPEQQCKPVPLGALRSVLPRVF